MAGGLWMQKAGKQIAAAGNKGLLHEKLGIPAGQKIPTSTLNSELAALRAKAKGAKKLSAAELTKLHEIMFALRGRGK